MDAIDKGVIDDNAGGKGCVGIVKPDIVDLRIFVGVDSVFVRRGSDFGNNEYNGNKCYCSKDKPKPLRESLGTVNGTVVSYDADFILFYVVIYVFNGYCYI